MRKISLGLLWIVTFGMACYGQDKTTSNKPAIGLPGSNIKTNLLYDMTASFNLGFEFGLGRRTSLDVSGNWNPFRFSGNRKWKNLSAQPELRFWGKERYRGWFYGPHAHYTYYNVGRLPNPFSSYMRDHRLEGWAAGGGLSAGYRWNFSNRVGLEAVLGMGYAYTDYDKYKCATCSEKINDISHHYFGPTKAAINLIVNLGKGKPLSLPAAPLYVPPVVEVAPEVVPPYVPQFTPSYLIPAVESTKERSYVGEAFLDFAAGQTTINLTYKNNTKEVEKLDALVGALQNDPYATIEAISIIGYASPEGIYHTNMTLSQKRATALKNLFQTRYGFAGKLFTVESKGEDWETLDNLVAASTMSDKDEILQIIRSVGIFDGREKKLMDLNGGNPYREMKANLFPQLRRTEYHLHYTVEPFTIDRGKEVFQTKPGNLSLNEMFLIADTYKPGTDEFNQLFETAARLFPEDDTANLNAAASALARKDVISAQYYLKKTKVHTAAYYNNLGICFGLQGEYAQAAEAFDKAIAAGSKEAIANREEAKKARE